MLKVLLIFTISVVTLVTQAQVHSNQNAPFFKLENSNISFGGINGMGPNLRNDFARFYYFIEGNSQLAIKNIPFKLAFRNSNEQLRVGKTNYFRFSYDPIAYRRDGLANYYQLSQQYLQEQTKQNKYIKELESKLAFIYQKKLEYELKANQYNLDYDYKDTINWNIPNNKLDSLAQINLPQLPTANNIELDKITISNPYQYKLDSLNALENIYSTKISDAQLKLNEINGKYDTSLINYNAYKNKLNSFNFLSNVTKMDIGLTTMKTSSFSNNALPFEGVRFAYETGKYFVDASAGFTLPNQLVTNKVFDQVVYNTSNALNASSFFQIKSKRFISSLIAGVGKTNGNHVAIENFYGGSINLPGGMSNTGTNKSVTTNIASNLLIKPIKGLSWKNAVGVSWFQDDSVSKTENFKDKIGLASTFKYEMNRSVLEFSYRYLSKGYDGWLQGVFLKHTDKIELMYRQNIGSRIRTNLRLAMNRFAINGVLGDRKTNDGTVDINLKLTKSIFLSGSYTLLQLQERKSMNVEFANYSHIGRFIATTNLQRKNYNFTTNQELSHAQINSLDTSQQISQIVSGYRYQMKKLGLGLQLNYNYYHGLHLVYGHSIVIQPEITYRIKDFYFVGALNYLVSEQFGNKVGARAQLGFVFDRFIDVNLQFQRYLPTDFLFFFESFDTDRKPNYLKLTINVHLFSPHKKRKI